MYAPTCQSRYPLSHDASAAPGNWAHGRYEEVEGARAFFPLGAEVPVFSVPGRGPPRSCPPVPAHGCCVQFLLPLGHRPSTYVHPPQPNKLSLCTQHQSPPAVRQGAGSKIHTSKARHRSKPRCSHREQPDSAWSMGGSSGHTAEAWEVPDSPQNARALPGAPGARPGPRLSLPSLQQGALSPRQLPHPRKGAACLPKPSPERSD